MLVNLKEVLTDAHIKGYAVGAFNTSDLEITQAIIQAAVELESPVIVQTSEKAIDYAGLEEISSLIRIEAIKAKVPVVLHLDHGKKLDLIYEVMKHGYTSVMFDTSVFPEGERISLLKEVTTRAHMHNISVEGERDSIGGKEDYVEGDSSHLTDPQKAYEFVENTGIDAFAVSIGNVHGNRIPGEKLDLELLRQIRQRIEIPLVLHGASSTPQELVREAIEIGINKINIDTDLRHAFTNAIRDQLSKDNEVYDPRDILGAGKEGIRKAVMEKIQLFGSAGKA